MSYEFTKLSEVPAVSEFPEGANAIIETNGEIKRCPSSGGGGGTSSADVFIIHTTSDETYTNAQFDKTPEQICEAYQSGKYCLACLNGIFIPVVSVETYDTRTLVQCYGWGFPNRQGHILGVDFVTNDGVTWSIKQNKPILYNVCFSGLQIYGSGNIPYTISVDADGNITATAAT